MVGKFFEAKKHHLSIQRSQKAGNSKVKVPFAIITHTVPWFGFTSLSFHLVQGFPSSPQDTSSLERLSLPDGCRCRSNGLCKAAYRLPAQCSSDLAFPPPGQHLTLAHTQLNTWALLVHSEIQCKISLMKAYV